VLKPVLTANWRYVAYLNFNVDPSLMLASVPQGTELDFIGGKTFVTLIAFLFMDAEVTEPPPPRNRDFELIALQFYVRKKSADTWRRGVVTLRQLLPRTAFPLLARIFAAEHFTPLSTRRDIVHIDHELSLEFGWRHANRWETMRLRATGDAAAVAVGSHEDFFVHREWRYASTRTGATEHRIEYPRWKIWTARAEINANFAALFGETFAETLTACPASAFIADGGPVKVLQRT
jgi:hypothetical protein